MKPDDAKEFFLIWDNTAEIYDKTLTDSMKTFYFRLLSRFELPAIRQALNDHMTDSDRGRFMPKPADIIAKIEDRSPSQWPGAEEAWARFPRDETQTGIVCDEMLDAWGVASELDEIAGRMAFRERYERLVTMAKAENRSPKWKASFGSDIEQRERIILDSVSSGLLTASAASVYLPHIPDTDLLALAKNESTTNKLLEHHAPTANSMEEAVLALPDKTDRETALKHLGELSKLLA